MVKRRRAAFIENRCLWWKLYLRSKELNSSSMEGLWCYNMFANDIIKEILNLIIQQKPKQSFFQIVTDNCKYKEAYSSKAV